MKFVSIEVATPVGRTSRLGGLLDADETGRIADLTACFACHLATSTDEPTPREFARLRVPPDMIGFLRAGKEGMKAALAGLEFARNHINNTGLDGERLVYMRSDVTLLAPVPRPPSFRDFSMYEEHMTLVRIDPAFPGAAPDIKKPQWYTNPPYYKGSTTAIAGPEDPVPWPYYTKRLDLELEIGIIVGRTGRNLTFEQARDHIAGYTLLIDSSARDGYGREPFGPNKRKDFHTAIGPALVTPDEAGDIENLACGIMVEDETWWEGSTSAPHSFHPEQLVAYVSDNETIQPGDLIGTGTIGNSCSMDTQRWVKLGQRVTFWMERLGRMTLEVVPGERVVNHVLGMEGLLKYRPSEI